MINRTKWIQGKAARMEMRTNQLIKNKEEIMMNRTNLKNYILMEVGGLIEAEEVEGNGPEVLMLLSLKDENREKMIKIVNFVVKVMKKKRRVTKFQIQF